MNLVKNYKISHSIAKIFTLIDPKNDLKKTLQKHDIIFITCNSYQKFYLNEKYQN